MNERERTHDPREHTTGAGEPAVPAGQELAEAAQSANAFLAAAQAAIQQVLSGNSLAFNQAVRQHGGQ